MAAILNFPGSTADATRRSMKGDDDHPSVACPCAVCDSNATNIFDSSANRPQGKVGRSLLGVPLPMVEAVEALRSMRRLQGLAYEEIPVPTRLADYGIGIAMRVIEGSGIHAGDGSPHGPRHGRRDGGPDAGGGLPAPSIAGWLMILYSTERWVRWSSCWRCVAYARATVDDCDPAAMLPQLCWDLWNARLDRAPVLSGSVGGTVSVVDNTGFGVIADVDTDGRGARSMVGGRDCELRISWTPAELGHGVPDLPGEPHDGAGGRGSRIDAVAQVNLWGSFLSELADLQC